MKRLIQGGLDKTAREAKEKERIGVVMDGVLATVNVVSSAIEAMPQASLVWSGVCVALEQTETSRNGIEYVSKQMEWYCCLSTDLSEEPIRNSQHPLATKYEWDNRITDLYQQLLLYQMKTVYSFYRHRGLVLRDIVNLDDWTGELTAIRDAEGRFKADTTIYTALQANSYLRQLVVQQLFEKELQYIQHLRLTDPRDDKKRIEHDKGGLLECSYRWVLQKPEFTQWRDNQGSRLLWILGDPGKGKTMLLCGIIDQLRREVHQATIPGLLSFCQATNKRINNATAVVRGLLYMLIEQRLSLLRHVRKKHEHAGERLFEEENAWFALSEILANVLQDPALPSACLIIDALDECADDRDRRNLLQFIVCQSSVSTRVKWIASSRNWPQIQEELKVAQNVPLSLELNAESVAAAVDFYIRHKTSQLSEKKAYDDETETAIRDYLSSYADGTFLWVALVCQNLESVPQWNAITELSTFPPGLDSLYGRMLGRLNSSGDVERCRHTLAIASVVRRPLVLQELLLFIDGLQHVKDSLGALRGIIGFCGSFLFLRGDKVYFVHQSAQDFLVGNKSAIFPSGVEEIHYIIFSKSLSAISKTLSRDMYGLRAPGSLISSIKTPCPDPLATVRYTCVYWVEHLCASGRRDDLQDHGLVHTFLEKYLCWLEGLSLVAGMSDGVLAMRQLENFLVSTSGTKSTLF
ncbi:NACHT domain-containing protein [Lasiosphaeria miniovina]|uniref:NACHT domain-containing protein n=1 Tax=Lasiosphaeria miniovina TaxID=1954250 RepID=A0AA40AWU2_9PEZI|nr:NACHT domain-containing protein [Lasiosphaeria miniovina]KAK0723463.1 NACHT domain-containing protein [Lasiosphaeria miniovina]